MSQIHSTQSDSFLARSQELEANLAKVSEDRNPLVHHFFWDNAVQQQSSQDRRRMAEGLKRIHARLRGLLRILRTNKGLPESVGVTEE
jgi:hypothetical protein